MASSSAASSLYLPSTFFVLSRRTTLKGQGRFIPPLAVRSLSSFLCYSQRNRPIQSYLLPPSPLKGLGLRLSRSRRQRVRCLNIEMGGAGAGDALMHSFSHSPLGLTNPSELPLPQVALSAKDVGLTEWKGDILAVGVFEADVGKDESGMFENSTLKRLDSHVKGVLSDLTKEEEFSGKVGQSAFARLPGFGFKRVGLIGLGKNGVVPPKVLKGFGETLAGASKTAQATHLGVTFASPEKWSTTLKLDTLSSIAAGVLLGIHEDNRFKSEAKQPILKSLDFLGLSSGPEFDQRFKYVQQVCSGVFLTRQLVNAPANVLTPSKLADEASAIAATYSDVFTAEILDVEQCMELKMGSYLGVAAASANPPKFIHLCYKPPTGDVKTKLAIVGKGLTFDSGGYNLKTGPGCSIELMKFDMGGSAAALGAAKAIGQIKPPGVEVHFIVAACENMISGTGMRPGDVITASNGKTIEVNNTDAEGRLTLADALVYACKQGVDKIVDLATLTGACVVALGSEIAGTFTPNDDLAEEISKASEVTGEKFWRMPMEESYWETMKSGIADMVNTGGRAGGSITAALFLKQFVDDNVKWLHIDMAGPVWSDKKRCATGFGVSTLVEWVLKNSS
uniref:TSA: Wollemia nobilis Ref_Wollemi_Transcript_14257_2196 transcribed RNA sequence n=1 Tax=Wollemia nobilis TaxID=56998 RepID=A0A0C9QPZ2_9CONI